MISLGIGHFGWARSKGKFQGSNLERGEIRQEETERVGSKSEFILNKRKCKKADQSQRHSNVAVTIGQITNCMTILLGRLS